MHKKRERRKQNDHYQSALNVAFFCRALLDVFFFSFDVKICLQFLNVCRLEVARSNPFSKAFISEIV